MRDSGSWSRIHEDLNKRLADRRGTITLDKKAKAWATEKGYDPVFGARPLKRFLQRKVETELARALMTGEVREGAEVAVTVQKDELAPVPAWRAITPRSRFEVGS